MAEDSDIDSLSRMCGGGVFDLSTPCFHSAAPRKQESWGRAELDRIGREG